MGSCKVVQAPSVIGKDGTRVPSKLYEYFKKTTGSELQAIYLWSQVHSKEFKDKYWNNLKRDENGEPLGSYFSAVKNSYNNRIQPVVPRIRINYPKKSALDEVGATPAIVEGKYKKGVVKDDNRRWVLNNFFRYNRKDSVPHYPFTTGDYQSNLKYVKYINSLFDRPVVEINKITGGITFKPDTADAEFKVNNPEKYLNEVLTDEVLNDGEIVTEQTIFGFAKRKTFLQKEAERVNAYTSFKLNLRRIYERKLSEKGVDKHSIRLAIDRLNSQISELRNIHIKNARTYIGNQIIDDFNRTSRQLMLVSTDISRSNSTKSLERAASILEEISYSIDGMETFKDFLTPEEIGSVADLRSEYLSAIKRLIVKYGSLTGFRRDFSGELFEPMADISTWRKNLFGLTSATDNELVQLIDDFMKQTSFAINKEMNQKRNVIENKVREVEKKSGLSGNKLWRKLLQFDENGEWTGNFLARYKKDYSDTRRKMKNMARNGEISWNKYWKWISENNKIPTLEELQSDKRPKRFTEDEWELIQYRLEQYEEDRTAYIQSLIDSLEYTTEFGEFYSAADERRFNKKVEQWEKQFSPYIFADTLHTMAKSSSYAGTLAFKYGYRYLPMNIAEDKWVDPAYTELESDKVLFDFYKFVIETINENNKFLPYIPSLPANYVPELSKTLGEKIVRDGTLSVIGHLQDSMIDAISEELDNEVDMTIEIAGKEVKNIPLHMMMGRLSPDEKSMNIPLILLEHTKMSLNHKYKRRMEPIIHAMLDILENTEEVTPVDNKDLLGTNKKNIYGTEVRRKNRLFNIRQLVEYTADAFLYDQRVKRGEGRSGIKLFKAPDKATKRKLERQLKNKEITLEEYNEAMLGLGREVTLGKVADALIKYTYVKALSIPNVVTPFVNFAFGMVSDFTYSAAGVDVDDRSMLWGVKTILKASIKSIGRRLNSETINKVYGFLDLLNVIADVNETHYGQKRSIFDKAVILQSKTEYLNQGSMALAILKFTKIKDKYGKDISIWDAFKYDDKTDTLVWDEEKMGKREDVPMDKIVTDHGVNIYRLRNKILRINQHLHGDYDSAIMGKKTAIGRILFLFKTWLPMSIEYRFGREMYSKELQRTVKGRYRSFTEAKTEEGEDVSFLNILGRIAKFHLEGKRALSDLSELDRMNLLMDIRELHFISMMTATGMLLSQMLHAEGGDDDDPWKEIYTIMINAITKAQADVTLYLNPSSAAQILDNLVPIFTSVKQLFYVTQASIDTLRGDPVYKSGYFKDKPKLLKWFVTVTPGVSSGLRMWSAGQRVFDYNRLTL